jgi:hypothetical protein
MPCDGACLVAAVVDCFFTPAFLFCAFATPAIEIVNTA